MPNFPRPGILFYDITSALAIPQVFRYIIDSMGSLYKNIEAVATREFLIGAPFAYEMGHPFIPIRNSRKSFLELLLKPHINLNMDVPNSRFIKMISL